MRKPPIKFLNNTIVNQDLNQHRIINKIVGLEVVSSPTNKIYKWLLEVPM